MKTTPDQRFPELASLAPRSELTRRDFVVTSLAAGFALAVQPVGAATISTSDEGLIAGSVRIPVADGELPAYRAQPATGAHLPIVLVVQEIFGVHEHIRDVCRRFAKLGYLAIAPELYARQGDVSQMKDIQQIITSVVMKVPDAQVMSDLDATVAWAGASGLGDAKRVAITGFCWGGRIVWLYAAHSPTLKAGAAWYGRIDGDRTALQPKYPLDLAAELKAPVLGLYGGQDQGIPLTDVEKMRAALTAARKPSDIHVYADAQHGFFADYRPSYDAKDAADAWQRLQQWFRKNGV